MRFLRVLIFILVLVLVGIGAYYAYLKLSGSKSLNLSFGNSNKAVTVETPRPFQFNADSASSLVSKFKEFSASDSTKGPITVIGHFQSLDGQNATINGVAYKYVVGVLDDSGTLTKVWVSDKEYSTIHDYIRMHKILPGQPVEIDITPNGVSFKFVPF